MARVTEEQLILPALYLMNISPTKSITTTEMKEDLVEIFKPTGKDNELAGTRGDTLFTQKVRNLKSHDKLEKLGYAVYHEKIDGEPSGRFEITVAGRQYLDKNMDIVDYLLNNTFSSEDLKVAFATVYNNRDKVKKIEIFDENATVVEGTQAIARTKVYKRSNKLRKKAIQFYTVNDRIKCQACCFDFEEFYGEYGKNFIEIHHQKPVFQFDGDDLERTIKKALENVIPVCSNCHRMIHRRRDNPLTLDELKEYVRQDLDFCSED
ncbi:Hnh endonuclease [Bathymodiolus thermophilus thioautotrophic gill symbiont]|uniref:Hnh endonuclease n=1 Tax=Bathymodiolus thermophilus thioautotrophic gill symbiont TaxID=2360 RepID=A0A3G3IQF1_9GAMM|nr:HNH endonuclease [Bathymodiolus thermophilus thioautotrophic gill symbiont]AYQ57712.1 Hnh endonuclease [Bathymodiolus thermophilus thioautotrophic gill symbiont]